MKLKSINACFLMLLLATAFSGCLKDKITRTYRVYAPVYKTVELVRSEIQSGSSRPIKAPGKIFVLGKYIFLNEVDKGVHIIDNSDPASPVTVSFINIAGNQDIAVKGNILYADQFNDLIAIDISDPLHTKVKSILPKAFPERTYSNGQLPDGKQFIVDWTVKDTTVDAETTSGRWPIWLNNCASCMFFSASSAADATKSLTGIAGSTARFSLVNNTLYAVGTTSLGVFNIAAPEEPKFIKRSPVGMNIETIFPMHDKLLMGSTSGVFIYDIQTPENPLRLSQFSHLTACDPVVAENNTAYVTLRSGVRCSNAGNQLDVLDITDLSRPSLLKTYPMTNPKGLSIQNKLLFICDDGLKVYNAADPKDIKLVDHKKGFEAQDIITLANLAIVVTSDGLQQFGYTQEGKLTLVGTKHWDN